MIIWTIQRHTVELWFYMLITAGRKSCTCQISRSFVPWTTTNESLGLIDYVCVKNNKNTEDTVTEVSPDMVK